MNFEGDYSQIADAQLDALEQGPDADLYNAVLDAIELIFRAPGQAQALSTAITTSGGIRMRLPVAGHPPYKVFWSTTGPRIEAIFPHR
ncbi:hypothetical protein [Mycobacterium xenopi]|uniref:Uncharacterized protein n=1 Tax=Mycobacterium xenopi TaxID=1789 RepID=A0AAD1M217_MYCXE|nr:hypothetical protein [Mycobacterium xenopi]MDA3642244.1 hypothetical protein [Mycobacterium xenopi]MDA3659782.1 hypothetical protein [Mycobacterium xenopi]MDA3663326.1 hypothetical protein [Mycobacterium xenopi]ORX21284.1 hypothetical protein AWC32_00060 [Mycobacterium xenopi]SPX89355.1 Uncharacterised protein [Mycobacterium xenopi]